MLEKKSEKGTESREGPKIRTKDGLGAQKGVRRGWWLGWWPRAAAEMCNKETMEGRQTFGSCPVAMRCPVDNEMASGRGSGRGSGQGKWKGKGKWKRKWQRKRQWVWRHYRAAQWLHQFALSAFYGQLWQQVQRNQEAAKKHEELR